MNYLKVLVVIFLMLGLVDSIYEAYVYFKPTALVCSDTGIIDCQTVITSQYSTIIGIPLAILGLTWFIVSIFMTWFKKINSTQFPLVWYFGGFLGFIYSVVAQILIGKICIYCTFLDSMIVLSIIAMFYYRSSKNN